MNLPNRITVFRILLIPVIIIVSLLPITGKTPIGITYSNLIILALFLIASFTDFLDGYLARKNNLVTTFGKFLDPIADKLLVVTLLVMLVEEGKLPAWIPIIIVAREFIVSGIRMIAAGEGNVIAASWLGKIKTVSQMVAISLAIIDTKPFMAFATEQLATPEMVLNVVMSLAMIISVFATIYSGIDYFVKSKDILLKSK